jgi:formate dehydrogenase subunit gamma
MSNTTPSNAVVVEALVEQMKSLPGGLLPLLHKLQERIGHVPQEAIPAIARGFALSRAEVQGVISFYHDFRTTPPARHVVKICRAESCQAMGNAQLIAHAKQKPGIDFGAATADREFGLEAVYCLGNCALSPALTLDDNLHGRVSPARFDALIDAARGAK